MRSSSSSTVHNQDGGANRGGRWWKVVGQVLFSRSWAHFGAVPLLIGHVASLPYYHASENGGAARPQTLWFLLAALAVAGLDAAARAWRRFSWTRSSTLALAGLDAAARAWRRFSWTSSSSSRALALLCAANCLLVSTCLFMVFCQGYPSTDRSSRSSEFYQNTVIYAEHAYMLGLMAVCRIVSAAATTATKTTTTTGADEADKDDGGAARSSNFVEAALNGACLVLFVVVCAALMATGGGNGENLRMNTWVVPAEQRWMHWLLFLILMASYYAWEDDANEEEKKWVVDAGCRLAAVLLACLAFDVHMTPATETQQQQSRFNAIDYFALRRIGSLRDLSADEETWWVVALRIAFLQLWIALVAGRWFAECMRLIRQRLRDDGVEYAVHHAADVEDMAFALSAASVFGGSYAASPRQLIAPSSSNSSVAPHNFFLFRMLAWQVLSPVALAVGFGVLNAPGWAMDWRLRRSQK